MSEEDVKQGFSKNTLAFIKLEGEGLEDGIISARTGSAILDSIDRVITREIIKKYPAAADIKLDIPVQVEKGSWAALIPTDLVEWVITAVGAGATSYAVKAGQSLATNDINEKGIKDLVSSGFSSLQSTIKIAKHLKGTGVQVDKGVKFKNNNQTLLIPNTSGEYIEVTRSDYDNYLKYPEGLLGNIANSPKNNQVIKVGHKSGGKFITESVTFEETEYFQESQHDKEEDNYLFPELKHGEFVKLVGKLTRANSRTNNMGFEYKGHVLISRPAKGKVEQYKDQLFTTKCVVTAEVQRLLADSLKDTSRSPRLVIHELEVIKDIEQQTKLI